MINGLKFGNEEWKGKWLKFEMDVIEYEESGKLKTKVNVKGLSKIVLRSVIFAPHSYWLTRNNFQNGIV